MPIKVVIAFSNLLLATGVFKLLQGCKEIEVIDVLKMGSPCKPKVSRLAPDIVLVDLLTLYNGFKDTASFEKTKFVLFDTACGVENISSAVAKKGLSKVIPANATERRLIKTIIDVNHSASNSESMP